MQSRILAYQFAIYSRGEPQFMEDICGSKFNILIMEYFKYLCDLYKKGQVHMDTKGRKIIMAKHGEGKAKYLKDKIVVIDGKLDAGKYGIRSSIIKLHNKNSNVIPEEEEEEDDVSQNIETQSLRRINDAECFTYYYQFRYLLGDKKGVLLLQKNGSNSIATTFIKSINKFFEEKYPECKAKIIADPIIDKFTIDELFKEKLFNIRIAGYHLISPYNKKDEVYKPEFFRQVTELAIGMRASSNVVKHAKDTLIQFVKKILKRDNKKNGENPTSTYETYEKITASAIIHGRKQTGTLNAFVEFEFGAGKELGKYRRDFRGKVEGICKEYIMEWHKELI